MNLSPLRTTLIALTLFASVNCAQDCAATTIKASAIIPVALPNLTLKTVGGFPELDLHKGFTRMIFLPDGKNPGIQGSASVTVSTTGGSFTARLPLCQDADQATCFNDPDYWVSVATFDGQSVTGGKNPVITGLTAIGQLQNLAGAQKKIMVNITASDDTGFGTPAMSLSSIVIATLPAVPVCSADVTPSAAFGNMSAGQATTPVQIISNATGVGNLTFKPDAHDNNGGLLKGDNGNTLGYSVTSSSDFNGRWNAADAQWRGDVTEDYALKLADVPSTTLPGAYQGTMTATISCE